MKYNKYVRAWLIVGCILLFFQIIIGGITRITGSGLSITKWDIVTGAIPPINKKDWIEAFDLYKETPQYKKINTGMNLSKFKFIYFWEFFHRLWARLMGLIFLFPLIYFIYKKWVDKRLLKQLSYVIFWAALAAIFGWIMVASGLINRPWVNAYKLSLHLGIALMTLSVLLWTTFGVYDSLEKVLNKRIRKMARLLLFFLAVQIFFGAIVSGMRAAVFYPTWPLMNGSFIPDLLLDSEAWSLSNFVNYDKNAYMPAFIHVLHRNWGYFVYAYGIFFIINVLRYPFKRKFHVSSVFLLVLLNLQVVLGILILLNSTQSIPVLYGILHQAIAIFILIVILYMNYILNNKIKDV